jgi:hypothetical protein
LHSPIFISFFGNPKIIIPSKFDFTLEFIDFDKIFVPMSSKCGNIFRVFFKEFILLIH